MGRLSLLLVCSKNHAFVRPVFPTISYALLSAIFAKSKACHAWTQSKPKGAKSSPLVFSSLSRPIVLVSLLSVRIPILTSLRSELPELTCWEFRIQPSLIWAHASKYWARTSKAYSGTWSPQLGSAKLSHATWQKQLSAWGLAAIASVFWHTWAWSFVVEAS